MADTSLTLGRRMLSRYRTAPPDLNTALSVSEKCRRQFFTDVSKVQARQGQGGTVCFSHGKDGFGRCGKGGEASGMRGRCISGNNEITENGAVFLCRLLKTGM